jgi:hypothetical protein
LCGRNIKCIKNSCGISNYLKNRLLNMKISLKNMYFEGYIKKPNYVVLPLSFFIFFTILMYDGIKEAEIAVVSKTSIATSFLKVDKITSFVLQLRIF